MVKPLVSYYGGKQRIASKILPYFPKHTIYVEPFCGGAALLFNKPIVDVINKSEYRECINDINNHLITLYKMAKLQKDELIKMIESTPYSQSEWFRAKSILKNGASDLEIAWATYIQCNCSFAAQMGGAWAISKSSENCAYTWYNCKQRLKEQIDRLEKVHISCEDALKCIDRWDSPETLFYCDPPYPSTDQGHYEGYTQTDFETLLNKLSTIKGSFVLSCYPNDAVPKEWKKVEFNTIMSASKDKSIPKERIDCIWIKESTETPRPKILKIYAKQEKINLNKFMENK
jgi:DNA adenine methylase